MHNDNNTPTNNNTTKTDLYYKSQMYNNYKLDDRVVS